MIKFSQQNPTLWQIMTPTIIFNTLQWIKLSLQRAQKGLKCTYFLFQIEHLTFIWHKSLRIICGNNNVTMKNLTWGPYYNVASYVLCCLLFIVVVSKWQFTISVEVSYLQDLPFVCWGDRSSIHLTSEEPAFGLQDLSQWVAFHPWVSHHCSGDSDYV